MNSQHAIAETIARGERWLERQHHEGCYFSAVQYMGDFPPDHLQPTVDASAYAAHYWAWAATMRIGRDGGHVNRARQAANWLVAFWKANCHNRNRLPIGPTADHEYFFNLGVAARGLLAVHRVTGHDPYADTGVQIVARMVIFVDVLGRFGPTSLATMPLDSPDSWRGTFGPHQRKAALALRFFNRSCYDVVDLEAMAMTLEPPAVELQADPDLPLVAEYLASEKKTKPTGKLAAELAEAERRADVKRKRTAADYCQPHAFSAEALLCGQYSHARAMEAIASLGERIASTPVLRTDVFASWCRARMLTGQKPTFPLVDIDRICAAQHPSGGWRVYMNEPASSGEDLLSVEATVIALQTLGIYNDRTDRTGFPDGPLGRRELVII